VRLYGVSMVRNEADIIRVNVLYHLSIGFDRLLIVDNGSTDGTDLILRGLGKDPRVRWTREPGPFRQGLIFTQLAREAFKEGADWVAPVDADDFWYPLRNDFKSTLASSSASVLRVQHIDFVQRREQRESSFDNLCYMTRKVAEPIQRREGYEDLLAANQISYIELARMPKTISRSSEDIRMVKGAHRVDGVDSRVQETDEIVLLHAPLRSLAQLEAKADTAIRRGSQGALTSGRGWHARRWQRLKEEGRLEQEWAANSYENDCLDVYGKLHPLVYDTALRDAVASFI
jgi:glycosyltransferase involved in cell wall biosynthesis